MFSVEIWYWNSLTVGQKPIETIDYVASFASRSCINFPVWVSLFWREEIALDGWSSSEMLTLCRNTRMTGCLFAFLAFFRNTSCGFFLCMLATKVSHYSRFCVKGSLHDFFSSLRVAVIVNWCKQMWQQFRFYAM